VTTIWLDVTDLAAFRRATASATGIQRVVASLAAAEATGLAGAPPLALCQFDFDRGDYVSVAWESIRRLKPAPRAKGIRKTLISIIPRRWRPRRWNPARGAAATGEAWRPLPGDWLLVAGAFWDLHGLPEAELGAKTRHGLRLAVLVYDLIPLFRRNLSAALRPEHSENFALQMERMLRAADVILGISRHTCDDVLRFARESGGSRTRRRR
jgi:hypothetical protein